MPCTLSATTPTFLVEAKKAHYAFTVKRNQKNLYQQLRTLPWQEATAKFYDRTTGHGRKRHAWCRP
ncbi:hypothetical protein [Streptomyces capitiformicae]|uniref:Uncharacterized protein n=1 Tax=Streptomyces capitiformicae TaxID=2014920 RepID=A0A919GCQ6_9ACTN|nr:hypothetical protein [Streptomyces capitiformicae]GHH82163.1 hypothetical protein GCM10017771_05620 [Streptomyces capitiformicae]